MNDIGVVDVNSGALLRTIAPSAETPSALAISLDGRRLYVARSVLSSPGLPSGGVIVTLYDGISGAALSQFASPGFETRVAQLALDEAANRLLVVQAFRIGRRHAVLSRRRRARGAGTLESGFEIWRSGRR